MEIIRTSLFDSDTIQIGLVESRPLSDACGAVEQQVRHVVALPLSGVFAKHDAPGHHVLGTPSHAVFVAADTPYRISFPGAIGDRALTLRFGEDVASGSMHSNGLLSAQAILVRGLLFARLRAGRADPLESETLGVDLVNMSLGAMSAERMPPRRVTLMRRRAVERVRHTLAARPAEKWTVSRIARVAGLSSFHLCRVFRQTMGASVYEYVLRERLAQTLDAVLDGRDLSEIALDAGFASHSHFTLRFRGFFGCTPAALRRVATGGQVKELRRIMTAGANRSP